MLLTVICEVNKNYLRIVNIRWYLQIWPISHMLSNMKKCLDKNNPKSLKDYEQQATIHKSLANEARLMIVDSLKNCECSVGELTQSVGLDQSTVSKHLSVLFNAGIVDRRKEGNVIYYRLLTPCVLDMFKCTSQVLGNKEINKCHKQNP